MKTNNLFVLIILFLVNMNIIYGKNHNIKCKDNLDCRMSSSCIDGVNECYCYKNKCYFE